MKCILIIIRPCLPLGILLLLASKKKMSLGIKNLREKSQNYNSMGDFRRPYLATYDDHRNSKGGEHQFEMLPQLPFLKGKENHNQPNDNTRFEMLEQRIEIIERGHRGNMRESRLTTLGSAGPTVQDFQMFKQSVESNLTMQREEVRSFSSRYEQMQGRQAKMDQELKHWLNEQRQEVNYKFQSQAEEMRGQEYSKQTRSENQLEAVKGAIQTIARRVQEQREKTMKAHSILKQSLHREIMTVRQELTHAFKNDKDQAQKLFKELRTSFGMLRTMIETDRDQIKEAISSAQQTSDSITTKLAKTIEGVNNVLSERVSKVDKKIGQFKHEWNHFKVGMQQKMEENKEIAINAENNSINQMEKQRDEPDYEEFEAIKEEFNEWKQLSEQKNLNVFREMANSIKTMRYEFKQENEHLGKEMVEVLRTVKEGKKLASKQVKKEVQGIVAVMTEEFDALTDELEKTNDLIATAKRQTEGKIDQNSELLAVSTKQTETKLQKMSEMVATSTHQTKAKIEEMSVQMVTAKQEADRKMADGVKKDIDELKAIVKEVDSSSKKGMSEVSLALGKTEKSCSKAVEQVHANLTKEVETFERAIQGKLKEFVNSLNNEQKDLVTSVNTTTLNNNKKFTKQLEDANRELGKRIEEEAKKNEGKLGLASSELNKKIELSSEGTRKVVEAAVAAERGQTSKQLAKASDELTKLILEGSIKSKKDRQNSDKAMKQALDDLSKTTSSEIVTLKGAYDVKITELQKLTRNSESENKHKEEELKTRTVEIEKRFIDGMGKIKSDLTTEINKNKGVHVEELGKVRIELEGKIKLAGEQKARRESEIKAKELEIKAKEGKDAEIAKKVADLDQKVASMPANIRKDVDKKLAEDIVRSKNETEKKMESLFQENSKKQAENKAKESASDKKMDEAISNLKKEIQSEQSKDKKLIADLDKKVEVMPANIRKDVDKKLAEDISKSKNDLEKKMEALFQENSKKQAQTKAKESASDKKVDEAISSLRKEIQSEQIKDKKLVADLDKKVELMPGNIKKDADKKLAEDIAKSRNETERKMEALIQEGSNKQAEHKAKESASDKKVDEAISNLKKEILSDQTKDKKQVSAELVRLDGQVKRNSSMAELTSSNQAELRDELDKKMSEVKRMSMVSSRNQEAEFNRQQDQRLQQLQAQLSAQVEGKLVPLSQKMQTTESEIESLRQVFSSAMGETKQMLNKLEGSNISQKIRYKVMFEKMSTDLSDLADDLTLIMSEMKITKQ